MLLQNNGIPLLLLICTIALFILAILIARMKNKQQIHYAFLCDIILIFYWSAVRFTQLLVEGSDYVFFLEKIHYIGVCLIPVSLLLTGIIFARTRIEFSWKYLLLLIVPAVSIIMALTNDYHHLFIVKYSFISTEYEYGTYYIFHEIYSYSCIFVGIYFLLYFSIKNLGFFSRQSFFIALGIAFPLVVVILSTQKIVAMPVFMENISFSFAIFFFAIAIIRFQFLNVVPIALQKIVDLISDGYIVVNQNLEIIDYNRTFINTFQGIMTIKRKKNLMDLLSNPNLKIDQDRIFGSYKIAIEQKNSVALEEHIVGNAFDKYFRVEITPIFSGKDYLGSIFLFKDISEHKKNIEIIKRNQEVLMEQERMASLGQMIGGIAHNLKTPIMSLAGGIEALKDLAVEYRDSIGDKNVNREDHYEIADEMLEWLDKMKPYCSYMTDIIGAVKGQAVQMNDSRSEKFTVQELVKRIDLLMKHELKRYHCTLKTNIEIDLNTEIKGEINNLVQVIDNVIMNGIQAYEGNIGEIDFEIRKEGKNVQFILRDYGKGIPKEIEKKLFKEMITTKGQNGTGLGLYMSYSTIKGRFLGNMSFESKENAGTTFLITIPYLTTGQVQQEVSQ